MPEAVDFSVGGDSNQAVRALQNINKNLDRMNSNMKKVSSSSKKSNRNAFGPQVVSQIKSVALSYVGVQSGIRGVTAALKAMHDERKRGARGIEDAAEASNKLRQLAGGDQKRLADFDNRVAMLRSTYGINKTNATETVFQTESLGLRNDIKLFGRASRFTNSGVLAMGVGTLKNSFQEGNSSRAVINMLLQGSEKSKTKLDEFGPNLTIAAAGVRSAGGTLAEAVAAMSIISRTTKSAEVGGTQLGALADSLVGRKEFTGTFKDKLQQLVDMNLTPEQLFKILPNKRARKGFSALELNFEDFKQTLANVRRERDETGRGDFFARTANVTTPAREAEEYKRRSVQDRKLAEEGRFGTEELIREAKLEQIMKRSIERGENGLSRWGRSIQGNIAMFLGFDPTNIAGIEGNLREGFKVPTVNIKTPEHLTVEAQSQDEGIE